MNKKETLEWLESFISCEYDEKDNLIGSHPVFNHNEEKNKKLAIEYAEKYFKETGNNSIVLRGNSPRYDCPNKLPLERISEFEE